MKTRVNQLGKKELVNLRFAKRIQSIKTTVKVSNSFAVSPAENVAEPLDIAAGNNHMEVEEPLHVTNRTADRDNMDVEILQHIYRQIPNHEPTRKGHSSRSAHPSTASNKQDSDADSRGSNWDLDGAST